MSFLGEDVEKVKTGIETVSADVTIEIENATGRRTRTKTKRGTAGVPKNATKNVSRVRRKTRRRTTIDASRRGGNADESATANTTRTRGTKDATRRRRRIRART